MATAWYYALDGEQQGPVSTDELKALVANRRLSLDDLIWKKGLAEWIKVSQVRELAALSQVASSSSTSQPAPAAEQRQVQKPQVRPTQSPAKAPEPDELRLAPEPGAAREIEPQVKEVASQTDTTPKTQVAAQAALWYYARDGQQQGPVTAQFLKDKALSGELLPTDHLWKDGLKDWVAAGSLPGLKFPGSPGQSAAARSRTSQQAAQTVAAAVGETNEADAEPNENSIFAIMNDPGFAAAPAAVRETPNLGLMSAATLEEKPRRRGKIEFEGSPAAMGYMLAAFAIPIPLAFIMAYFYGILKCYIPYFYLWYVGIFLIGTVLAVVTCQLFDKAKMQQNLIVIGYLVMLGLITLYVSWASTITWAINKYSEDGEQAYFVVVLLQPAAVTQIALQVSIESETTSTRHNRSTGSGVFYFLLEAVFAVAAPVYRAYRLYNESD